MSRDSTKPAERSEDRALDRAGWTSPLQLQIGDVDIWRTPLDGYDEEEVAALALLLSPDEQARARAFYFDRDRRRFVVGRGALRSLLARYLGIAANEVRFRYTGAGKPALSAPDDVSTPLTFNLAHSDGLAVFAFTRGSEIGIDVERVREMPDWESIAEAYFTPLEQARLRAAPPPQRRLAFFRAWTRQEALLKANGLGLGAFDRGPDRRMQGEGRPVSAAADASGWRVYPFEPAEGFVASLAVGRNSRSAAYFNWHAGDGDSRAQSVRRGRRVRLNEMTKPAPHFL